MSVIGEMALIFGICLAGEGIAAVLPVRFPASVIGMLLLMVLLFSGAVKTRHIQCITGFLMGNMAFVFIPSCVSVMQQFGLVRPYLIPFVVICVCTTPLVYLVTGWTVQGLMALRRKGGGKNA